GRTWLGGGKRSGAIEPVGELRRDSEPVDVDVVRQRALALRPDVQALRRDRARSVNDVRLQVANGAIDYTISGEVHRQHYGTTGYDYGLFLSVPLPIFNRNQGEVARGRQETLQLGARVRALGADVGREGDAAVQ